MTERKKKSEQTEILLLREHCGHDECICGQESVYVARDCNESQMSKMRQVFSWLLDLDKHKQLVVIRCFVVLDFHPISPECPRV